MLVARDDRVATLTLHDPPVNPVARETVAALEELTAAIAADDSIRAVVVTGSGSAALYCLADMGIERAVISHPNQFVEKLFPSLAQTIAYIAEQIAANHQPLSSAVTSTELPVENTCEHRRSTFVPFRAMDRFQAGLRFGQAGRRVVYSLRGRF